MKIYVNFEIPKTVREFLKVFFSVRHQSDSPNTLQNVETYTDEKCTIVQCSNRRSRSFRKTCDCVQTYFPKATDKTIFRILLTLNLKTPEGTPLNLYYSFCSTVNRPVMYYSTSKPAYYNIGNQTASGQDSMSWSEIFGMWKLIDTKTIEAFIEKYKDR